MSFSTVEDINKIFGRTNVERWADLENDQDPADITARIDDALELADEYFKDRLLGGPYVIEEPLPKLFVYNHAKLAGLFLYESRGFEDADPTNNMSHARKEVDKYIDNLLNRRVRLGSVESSKSSPSVIKDE
jgi:phage gp36-like protein